MPRYAAKMQRTASTTLAVGSLKNPTSGTLRRIRLYELILGSEATPADNALLWTVQRLTALGSEAGTTVTPQAMDPADPAAVTVGLENITTNATLGSTYLLAVALNQKATLRWSAAPDGELISPATASNGFALLTPTAPASLITATTHFRE